MTAKESAKLSELHDKIDLIVRGVYGDPANGVAGLLDRQKIDDERWEKIMPLFEYTKEIPQMVRVYKLLKSPKIWATLGTAITGAITWLAFNIEKLKDFLK